MVASLDEEVVALFDGQRLEDPYPIWNRLREEAPVFSSQGMVILSRFSDVKTRMRLRDRLDFCEFRTGSILSVRAFA